MQGQYDYVFECGCCGVCDAGGAAAWLGWEDWLGLGEEEEEEMGCVVERGGFKCKSWV